VSIREIVTREVLIGEGVGQAGKPADFPVKLTHDGLSLWFSTPDAPTPRYDELVPRSGASIVIGVHPWNPTNAVFVRYRIDGGTVQTVPGREVRVDLDRQAQYFAATFPTFYTGDLVEYSPALSCGGRQVPPPHIADRFPAKFRLAPRQARAAQPVRTPRSPQHRFTAGLNFVATVAVEFDTPQFIGETAEGMRVNFLARGGTVDGDGFSGKVIEGSSDHLIVRRDGMGVVRIRAAFAADDGAILDVEAGGYVNFGPDGYRRAVAHHLPDRAPLVVSPLISTRHPKYRWLARIQCIGVGQTHLDAGQATYDVYAVSPRGVTATI
jgi:hypothetical protein